MSSSVERTREHGGELSQRVEVVGLIKSLIDLISLLRAHIRLTDL